MPRPVPKLKGELIILRPIGPEADAQDYYEWNLEPEIHLWTGNSPLESVEAARQELKQFASMDDITMWAIEDKAGGKMVGRFFVGIEERDGQRIGIEGNRIAKPFWRKGYNREARRLVFEYVFNTLKTDAIETKCWRDNINSRQSILAHGFRLIDEKPTYNAKHEQTMLESYFRLDRSDWLRP